MSSSDEKITVEKNIRQALVRADLWLLISQGFYTPTAKTREKFLAIANDLSDELEKINHPLQSLVSQWKEAYQSADLKALEYEYHSLFTTDVLVNPYEGGYQRQDRGGVIGDICAFYQAFELTPEDHCGPPDSLWNECAFLSWMSLKEANALEQKLFEALDITRSSAAKFLQDHLGRWVGAFCNRLIQTSGNPVFVLGADLMLKLTSMCLDEFEVKEVHPFELIDNEEISGEVACPASGVQPN